MTWGAPSAASAPQRAHWYPQGRRRSCNVLEPWLPSVSAVPIPQCVPGPRPGWPVEPMQPVAEPIWKTWPFFLSQIGLERSHHNPRYRRMARCWMAGASQNHRRRCHTGGTHRLMSSKLPTISFQLLSVLPSGSISQGHCLWMCWFKV